MSFQKSAFDKFATYTVIDSNNNIDPMKYFKSVENEIKENYMKDGTKFKMSLESQMVKTDLKTGDEKTLSATFHGKIVVVLLSSNRGEVYKKQVGSILENIAKFQKEGSNW